jgi:hypothetical protein
MTVNEYIHIGCRRAGNSVPILATLSTSVLYEQQFDKDKPKLPLLTVS